jgi:uncharacterized protein
MRNPVPYKIQRQQLWLSGDRSVFWEEEKALILTDSHFGKTGHFRKSGIGVPQSVFREDLQRLVAQIQHFQPRQLIIVGDMFHSHANKELELFLKWRSDLPDLVIHLVEGNHDILKEDWYGLAGIRLSRPDLLMSHFQFVHDITDHVFTDDSPYHFSGHIHPGIRLNGSAKQSLCFPCFYFGKYYAVLPAFSRFTGVAIIRPEPGENVFAIVNDDLVQLQ